VLAGNAVLLVALFTGTYLVAMSTGTSTAAWSPWSGDIILVAAGLLFLGLAFLLPLHAGLINLGIHGQFLVGFVAGSLVTRNTALLPGRRRPSRSWRRRRGGPERRVVIAWLKRKFAVHEILSGLLISAALVPIARVFGARRRERRPS
jgi:simple sugar transport system permease protein